MYPDELQLYIAGEWVDADDRETAAVVNPATEEVLGRVPLATTADLDAALDGAARGFPQWRARPPQERGAVLRRAAALLRDRAEPIATAATLEEGKTRGEMSAEIRLAADIFDWYAEEGRRAYGRTVPPRQPGTRVSVVREPVGPVAAFAAWNFPVVNPVRKIAAALAAGCPCILKPAEETPASALAVARALHDAGLPAGVLSVLFGVPARVSAYLLASPVVRKLSFTGSVGVGKRLARLAADRMLRTTLELGGHAPVLVLDDASVDRAAAHGAVAKFLNAGQVCVSPTRFCVHEAIYERFLAVFSERARSLVVGDGSVEGTQMGPLAHARRPAAVRDLVDDAVACGGTVVTGGHQRPGAGYFWEPTVLTDVPIKARVMNEEPFGPIAVVNRVSDVEEAIAEANRLPFGLAAYAFTESARAARRIGEGVEAGMLGINTFAISVPEAPFGGVKESGHGSEEGTEGLDGHLVTKAVHEA